MAVRCAVIADTHIPGRARDLPAGAWKVIESCDVIFHAGDVVRQRLLDRLSAVTALHAVRGNNDAFTLPQLPTRLETDVDGVRVAMVHDSGPSQGRRARMLRQFAEARVIIFGHSHIPICEDEDGLLLLNPGSPTDRRRMPTFSMAVLTCDRGAAAAEIIDLGLERAAG